MLKLLTNRWLIRILGFLALTVVVLLLGPFFAFGAWRPLESLSARWIFILLIVVAWLVRHLVRQQKASRAQNEMVGELLEQPEAPAAPDASAEELATIRERFEEAVEFLKKSKRGRARFSLYDLPWYIIIGPPGAGKTTAFTNSGLRFPLADRFGPDAIRGVGGTRNCDWWFTEDAVLIDTAGRYTTQDSDSETDRTAWQGFLDLLRKHRKRRPINGVFIAISMADLLTQSEHERRAHVAAVRKRVIELDRHFGIRFPVYVLFTKCDLVAGFSEYFEDLGRREREQVWGFTFPYSDDPTSNPVERFDAEFDALVRRLNERLLERMAHEPDIGRRSLIHGFPKQMAALKASLGEFLKDVFAGSRYEKVPLLRGAYFTSATQEGTPIDRLMSALARTFQVDAQALAPQTSGGKSYFLTDVFKRVALPESSLAGTNRRVELQRAWMQRGAYVGIGAAAALLVFAWGVVYVNDRASLRAADTAAQETAELVAEVDQRDYDPMAVLPALNAARNLPGGYADQSESGLSLGGLGLSQMRAVGDEASASYRRLLEGLFLSRVILRLENELRLSGPSTEGVYETLRTYLMLDSQEHYDAEAIKGFLREDWDRNLRRAVSTEQRAALDAHLEALFARRPAELPLPLSDSVIADAREVIRQIPLDERIYTRLKRSFDADIPGFNIRDAGGGAPAQFVFIRKSGRPLGEPLPGLFTKQAYQEVFLSRSRALTSQLASESWVLGEEQTIGELEEQRLLGRVRNRYLEEFAELYRSTLLDVGIAPFSTPDEAAQIFNVLARPEDSPLVLLLQEVSRQTSLESDMGSGLAARAESINDRVQERLQRLLGTREEVPDSVAELFARNAVEDRFAQLRRLVEQREGQPRPVDHLLDLLRQLYEYLSVASLEAAGGAIPPRVQQQGQQVVQALNREANAQPDLLVGELLSSAAARTSALTTGGLREYLNEQWRSGPLTECRQAIAGRYPVADVESPTIRLDDFAQFFGYGGSMDTFYNTHLRQYVDASRSPWRTRTTGNVPIELSAAALRAFEAADVIKRTFFRPGSMEPSISFNLTPLELDPSLSRFLLDLEGTVLTYEFGPQTPTLVQWPGPNPGTEVRVEMRDRDSGATLVERHTGPWAWFKLLDGSDLRTAGSERFEVTFMVEGRRAIYELTARSAFNPFALPQLERFECPRSL